MRLRQDPENPRRLVASDVAPGDPSVPAEVEIAITYTGDTGGGNAAALDRHIIPAILAAFPAPAPSADPRFADTVFVVEADDFAQAVLRSRHARDSAEFRADPYPYKGRDWKPDQAGFSQRIGTFGGMPVVVNLSWSTIDGRRVLFYYANSVVTHGVMVNGWLASKCNPTYDGGRRRARCDAGSFHLCLHEIDRLNADPAGRGKTPGSAYSLEFSDAEWSEIDNLAELARLEIDRDLGAGRLAWMAIGLMALGKAQRIEDGGYGMVDQDGSPSDDGVDEDAWADELRTIASKIYEFFQPGDGKI